MRELIYRDDAIKVVNDNEKIGTLSKWKIGWNSSLYYVRRKLEELPPAQPEQRTGYFIGTEFDGYADGSPVYYEWECSECGCVFEDDEPTYNYCPNCGAKMVEK